MKKTFTACLLSVIFLVSFGCSKDIQKPAKISNTAATTTTNTSSQSGDQNGSGHTCGSGHSDYNSGGY